MQFPCDSYSEILKTTMNEFFNFQLRRCTSQKSINRNHYIPSEPVVQLARQPPRTGCEGTGGQEERREFTRVVCNFFIKEKGKGGDHQHAARSAATATDAGGARRGGACSTLKLQSSRCRRARSAQQRDPHAGTLLHPCSHLFNCPTWDTRRSTWNKAFLLTSFSFGHRQCT